MCLIPRVCVCVLKTKKDKHETFSLLLLDKRCMTSVMKVCGIILLYYSPYTLMTCLCCNLCALIQICLNSVWDRMTAGLFAV